MARQELDYDCERWLLPQFLMDDDDGLFAKFRDTTTKRNGGGGGGGGFNELSRNFGRNFDQLDFGYGFSDLGPFGCRQSDLGSPFVEAASNETECDDHDDYFTELTRKFARPTLQDSTFGYENKWGWDLSGSPQSTLRRALVGGCGCGICSSRGGSPNCLSEVASPTTPTGMKRNETAWDLVHVAAGEIARMRMMEEAAAESFQRKSIKPPSLISVPPPPPATSSNRSLTRLSYQQILKAVQFEQVRQQQMMKQQMVLNRWRKLNAAMVASITALQEQSSPLRQQAAGSGSTKPLSLGNSDSKTERAGTGVFLPLPRGTTPSATRKKQARSTGLPPEKVVQSLNLNLESLGSAPAAAAQPKSTEGWALLGCETAAGALGCGNGVAAAAQRRQSVKQQTSPQPTKQGQEIHLPQDWTY